MVVHQASLWCRGLGQLRNGLSAGYVRNPFIHTSQYNTHQTVKHVNYYIHKQEKTNDGMSRRFSDAIKEVRGVD